MSPLGDANENAEKKKGGQTKAPKNGAVDNPDFSTIRSGGRNSKTQESQKSSSHTQHLLISPAGYQNPALLSSKEMLPGTENRKTEEQPKTPSKMKLSMVERQGDPYRHRGAPHAKSTHRAGSPERIIRSRNQMRRLKSNGNGQHQSGKSEPGQKGYYRRGADGAHVETISRPSSAHSEQNKDSEPIGPRSTLDLPRRSKSSQKKSRASKEAGDKIHRDRRDKAETPTLLLIEERSSKEVQSKKNKKHSVERGNATTKKEKYFNKSGNKSKAGNNRGKKPKQILETNMGKAVMGRKLLSQEVTSPQDSP